MGLIFIPRPVPPKNAAERAIDREWYRRQAQAVAPQKDSGISPLGVLVAVLTFGVFS